VGIGGIHSDEVLTGEFLSATTWAEWKSSNPDSKESLNKFPFMRYN
jgi:hypothetical protein